MGSAVMSVSRRTVLDYTCEWDVYENLICFRKALDLHVVFIVAKSLVGYMNYLLGLQNLSIFNNYANVHVKFAVPCTLCPSTV